MDDNIYHGNPLFSDAAELRDQLIALGGHDRLVAKIQGVIACHHLHGGQVITLRNHLAAAREILK